MNSRDARHRPPAALSLRHWQYPSRSMRSSTASKSSPRPSAAHSCRVPWKRRLSGSAGPGRADGAHEDVRAATSPRNDASANAVARRDFEDRIAEARINASSKNPIKSRDASHLPTCVAFLAWRAHARRRPPRRPGGTQRPSVARLTGSRIILASCITKSMLKIRTRCKRVAARAAQTTPRSVVARAPAGERPGRLCRPEICSHRPHLCENQPVRRVHSTILQ